MIYLILFKTNMQIYVNNSLKKIVCQTCLIKNLNSKA